MRRKTSSSQLNKPAMESWETEVIALCRKGAREPFARLVDHYRYWAFALLFRWVGQKELAEEMAQEVFIKAYSQIRKFRGEAKFSSWLYQIIQNQCRDYWRSRQFRNGLSQPLEEALEVRALSPRADEELARKRKERKIHRALETLPEKYREALMLRYLHELPYQEMAEQLGEGVSGLKMRVMRGLKLLKSKLGEDENES